MNPGYSEFTLPPGTLPQSTVLLPNEGDETVDGRFGSIEIVFEEKEQDSKSPWKRSGYDLIYTKTMTVIESLIGIKMEVPHLIYGCTSERVNLLGHVLGPSYVSLMRSTDPRGAKRCVSIESFLEFLSYEKHTYL